VLPQFIKLVLYLFTQSFQLCTIISEKYKIVQVTGVAFDSQFMFDKVIERVQVDVGQKLACQISDRQPSMNRLSKSG